MLIDILKTQKSGYYKVIIATESRNRRKVQVGEIHGTVTIWQQYFISEYVWKEHERLLPSCIIL